MTTIAIIGASGFLGTKLMRQFQEKGYTVFGTYNDHQREGLFPVDISDPDAVSSFLRLVGPKITIHAAAIADPDICEQNSDMAEAINIGGTQNVVAACRRYKSKLVYVSTNGIFDGVRGDYTEEDPPHPVNVYGKTKVAAEQYVLKVPTSLILRFDILYGYNGPHAPNGFFGSVINAKDYPVMHNQQRQPLLADDVGTAIHRFLEHQASGIYHLAGLTAVSKYDLGVALEQIVRPNQDSQLCPIEQEKKIAPRPKNTTLDTSKAYAAGVRFHSLEEGLAIVRAEYNGRKI